jgi:hypothetical protein
LALISLRKPSMSCMEAMALLNSNSFVFSLSLFRIFSDARIFEIATASCAQTPFRSVLFTSSDPLTSVPGKQFLQACIFLGNDSVQED